MPKLVDLPKSLQVSKEEEKFRERNAAEIESKAKENKRPCTTCKIVLFAKDVKVHPVLGVTVCSKCLEFYKSGAFQVDDEGDLIFCTWCGNGGQLFFCSSCKVAAFCKVCIKTNLGIQELKKTESDDWICYYCNSKPIWKLRAYCHSTVLRIEKGKNVHKNRRSSESDEEEDEMSPMKSKSHIEKRKRKNLKKERKPGSKICDSSQATPSTSCAICAIESSDEEHEEHYCSSSDDEELPLKWLSDMLISLEVFNDNNKEFLRAIKQQCQALDSESTEKVTKVGKKVHNYLTKCITVLTSHRGDFNKDYFEWCNKLKNDKISDAEIENNHNASSLKEEKDANRKMKRENKKESKAAEPRTNAEPKEKKETKKKSKDDKEVTESRTEAEPSGSKSTKKRSREDEDDNEECRTVPESNSRDEKRFVSTTSIKSAALRKSTKLLVPDEFAHTSQLHQKCVVKLTRCDDMEQLQKRGSDEDLDKPCNLEELDNSSPAGESKKKSQRKKSKANKNSDDSSRESDAQDEDVPDLKASPTIYEFKPVNKDKEAKRALLQDSDELAGSGKEDSKEQ